jgi:hypothetical protein
VSTSSPSDSVEKTLTNIDSLPNTRRKTPRTAPPLHFVWMSTVALMLAIASASATIRSPAPSFTWMLANDGLSRISASIGNLA